MAVYVIDVKNTGKTPASFSLFNIKDAEKPNYGNPKGISVTVPFDGWSYMMAMLDVAVRGLRIANVFCSKRAVFTFISKNPRGLICTEHRVAYPFPAHYDYSGTDCLTIDASTIMKPSNWLLQPNEEIHIELELAKVDDSAGPKKNKVFRTTQLNVTKEKSRPYVFALTTKSKKKEVSVELNKCPGALSAYQLHWAVAGHTYEEFLSFVKYKSVVIGRIRIDGLPEFPNLASAKPSDVIFSIAYKRISHDGSSQGFVIKFKKKDFSIAGSKVASVDCQIPLYDGWNLEFIMPPVTSPVVIRLYPTEEGKQTFVLPTIDKKTKEILPDAWKSGTRIKSNVQKVRL